MPSILQALIETEVLAVNNSLFSRPSRGRKEKESEIDVFILSTKIMTHLGVGDCNTGEHLCLLSRRAAEPCHYHRCHTNASQSPCDRSAEQQPASSVADMWTEIVMENKQEDGCSR